MVEGTQGVVMPTIEFELEDLENLLGKKIGIASLKNEGILFAKGEIEEENKGTLKVDIKDTNRPDLWSVEGIARELRGHYRIKEGLPMFAMKKSGLTVVVDEKVGKVRPKTVCAVVKNLKLDDISIKQMIQLQEKICQTFGRDRDMAAIGIYDYDRIKGPVRYTTFKPEELKFTPLGMSKKMNLKEILEIHPKGQEYGYLLKDIKEYPIFIDEAKKVLSMPPIINSDYTGKVDEKTKNVFIEVSGHNVKHISVALNVIVAALKERGGEIRTVDVKYGNETLRTPNLKPKKTSMDVENCRKILGMDISGKEMVKLLRQARFEAEIRGGKIEAYYLPYRNDIMDERDIIEEIAISFGYNDIEPEEPCFYSRGSETCMEKFSNKIREICIGLGLQEVMNFTLSSKEDLLEKMGANNDVVEIENPVSSNWSVFRNSLVPGCLKTLSYNKHVEYPQKIFEIGNVIKIDEKRETRTADQRKLAVVITDRIIGYENISSVLDSLLANLGVSYVLKEAEYGEFIEGRCASVFSGNKKIGGIGELHPKIIENFCLDTPVVILEIDLDNLMKLSG